MFCFYILEQYQFNFTRSWWIRVVSSFYWTCIEIEFEIFWQQVYECCRQLPLGSTNSILHGRFPLCFKQRKRNLFHIQIPSKFSDLTTYFVHIYLFVFLASVLQLGETHEKTRESAECLRLLTQQAVLLQRKMNDIYSNGKLTTGLPPIHIQPPTMGSVLDMLNTINGILFVQIR